MYAVHELEHTQHHLEHRQYLAEVGLVPALKLGPGLIEDAEVASASTNELGLCCTGATCVAVLDAAALGVGRVTRLQ